MADNVQNIKLGITQEQFVQRTHDHLETLYETSGQAQLTANEALLVAQGKSLSISKDTVIEMVSYLKDLESGELSVGDNIFITEVDVPDFWISGVSTTHNNTNTVYDLISSDYGPTQFGYYTVSKLETQKVIADTTSSVKSITINNGTANYPDIDGNVNLTLRGEDLDELFEDLHSNYVTVTPETREINGKYYKVITIKDTDTPIDVLNSSGQSVLTQIIRRDGNLYFCVGDDSTYTLRKLDGKVFKDSSDSSVATVVTLYNHFIQFESSTYEDNIGTELFLSDANITLQYVDNFDVKTPQINMWLLMSPFEHQFQLNAKTTDSIPILASGIVTLTPQEASDSKQIIATIYDAALVKETLAEGNIAYYLEIKYCGYHYQSYAEVKLSQFYQTKRFLLKDILGNTPKVSITKHSLALFYVAND